MRSSAVVLAISVGVVGAARADEGRVVRTVDELRRAAATAEPGDRIRVAPGEYAGGVELPRLRGAKGKPVVIEGLDPAKPPLFRGGGAGLHLTSPSHVELRHLSFVGQTGNGVNVDDGGDPTTPAEHLVLVDLAVRDVGPKGNCDGIKMSGVVRFLVKRCVVERWGSTGSGLDLVGCSDGTVTECTFRHVEGAASGSGVQAKGGSNGITVRRNRFEHAASRAVNVGGSTGPAYFRPPLETWKGPRFEAKGIEVAGNVFVGSDAAAAFVGADAPVFVANTVYRPRRWALRILQETRDPGFVPSQDGVVEGNLFVFRSDAWSEGGVNRGPGTRPETFHFRRNAWFCEDRPEETRSLVRLPTPERDGVYGTDPKFVDAAAGDLRLAPDSALRAFGADSFRD